jgi:predicted nucleic acid-binding protein
VADSSYLVESLLTIGDRFESETMVAPDLAIHEVTNALYVQQFLLNSIKNGLAYVDKFYEAVDAKALEVVTTSKALVGEAFEIASRNGGTTYDCLFVALALRMNLELKTIDKGQARIFESEKSKRVKEASGSREPRGSSQNDWRA